MKSVIRFATDNEVALNYFRPEPIKCALPEWYASLPVHPAGAWKTAKEFVTRGLRDPGDGKLTAKACTPMMDYMISGYLIRTFCDVSVSVETTDDQQRFWYVTPNSSQMSVHLNYQLPSIGDGTKRDYVKFNSPWTITTEHGYSCLFYQPEYLFERRFKLFPAIVDTDKYDNPVNFPGIFTNDANFTIEAGTPLMCVFPFKRTEFVSEIVSKKSAESMTKGIFRGGYKKFFRSKKSYE